MNLCAHGAQLVRRTCFEQIGGYLPLENGGEDWCAEVTARMLGWNTTTFPEIRAIELRDAARRRPGPCQADKGGQDGLLHGEFACLRVTQVHAPRQRTPLCHRRI